MTEPILSNWVIYDHPSDFPDKWVLRQWDIIRESSEPQASPICITADTLERIRECVPAGLTCLGRSEDDDVAIFEVWL